MAEVQLRSSLNEVVLISINRLSPATTDFVAENEFLRWVDLNNLILALATLLTANLLIRHLEYDSPRRNSSLVAPRIRSGTA